MARIDDRTVIEALERLAQVEPTAETSARAIARARQAVLQQPPVKRRGPAVMTLVAAGCAAAIAVLLVPVWNHFHRDQEKPVANAPAVSRPPVHANEPVQTSEPPPSRVVARSNEPPPIGRGPPGSMPAPSGPAVRPESPPPGGPGRAVASAGPVTKVEGRRQKQVMERFEQALADETTDDGKFAVISRVMADEPNAVLRGRILEMATGIPGAALESFLTGLLATEEDAGVRSQVAKMLGRTGSEKSLGVLSKVAASDRTTSVQVGDFGGLSSARRAAIFAIAELAGRLPKIKDKAAAELRALPPVAAARDDESLADARVQALFQITRDAALLKPFYDRLRSDDADERVRGVVAFRFLKMKEAPAEVVQALNDASPDVRSWTALILGEIGDSKTGPALMAIAADTREAAGPRCNAIGSLGEMKYAAAADLMERLLTDPEPAVPGNAAVALYRITGKKVKQFPEGYRTD